MVICRRHSELLLPIRIWTESTSATPNSQHAQTRSYVLHCAMCFVQVLYIYDNLLSSIASIASSRLLTHLYCHNNQLTGLQGVQHLPQLQKLYAQGNCLTIVDGLTKAQHLQELHVSDQRAWAPAGAGQAAMQQQCLHQQLWQQQSCQQLVLQQQRSQLQLSQPQQQPNHLPQQRENSLVLINDGCLMQHNFNSTPPTPPTPLHNNPAQQAAAAPSSYTSEAAAGDINPSSSMPCTPGGLWFEPASLAAIAGSLTVLAAANCGITDPSPLAVLTRLQTLDLAGNLVAGLDHLQPVLGSLGCLQDLDLRRNPCVHSSSKYRDCVILAAADTLQQLDGEEVKPAHRAFLQAVHSRKARARQHRQQQAQEQLAQQVSHMDLGPGESSSMEATAGVDQHGHAEDFAIAAGHHAALTPRTHAAMLGAHGPTGPAVTSMKLQLPSTLQACRAGCLRPPAAAGFKPCHRKAARDRAAAAAGAAAVVAAAAAAEQRAAQDGADAVAAVDTE